MGFGNRPKPAVRGRQTYLVVVFVRSTRGGRIMIHRHTETVIGGDIVVAANNKVVLATDLIGSKRAIIRIPPGDGYAANRLTVEGSADRKKSVQIGLDQRADTVRGNEARRGNRVVVRQTLGLAQAFVVAKDEGLVLEDRSAGICAELVPPELRLRYVPVIGGVHGAVAQEFVSGAVELVRTGLGGGVNDSARGAAVFSRITGGQHGEFSDGIQAGIGAEHVAWSAVSRVVDADAVHTVVVLLRAGSGNRHLEAIAAREPVTRHDAGLRMELVNAGLQVGQVAPGTSVEGQFLNLGFVRNCADFRVGKVYGRGLGRDFHGLARLSDLHRYIQRL